MNTQPSINNITTEPTIDHSTVQPTIDHSTVQPTIDHSTVQPTIDHSTVQPQVKHFCGHNGGGIGPSWTWSNQPNPHVSVQSVKSDTSNDDVKDTSK